MAGKRPPGHLSLKMRRFYKHIVETFELEQHHLELLRLLCEALDRAEQARQTLADEGLYVDGRFGKKAHPAAAIERDSRLAAARLLRELDLDAEPAPEVARPPQLRRYHGA